MSRITINVPLAMQTYNPKIKCDLLCNTKVGAVPWDKSARTPQVKLFNIAEHYPEGFKLGTYVCVRSIAFFLPVSISFKKGSFLILKSYF